MGTIFARTVGVAVCVSVVSLMLLMLCFMNPRLAHLLRLPTRRKNKHLKNYDKLEFECELDSILTPLPPSRAVSWRSRRRERHEMGKLGQDESYNYDSVEKWRTKFNSKSNATSNCNFHSNSHSHSEYDEYDEAREKAAYYSYNQHQNAYAGTYKGYDLEPTRNVHFAPEGYAASAPHVSPPPQARGADSRTPSPYKLKVRGRRSRSPVSSASSLTSFSLESA